jgi:hypothetical protein
MPNEREIIVLCCLIVRVDHKEGVHVRVDKYAMHKAGKNYVPACVNDDHPDYSREKGFRYTRHRIKFEDILKVDTGYMRDDVKSLRREIYFFEPDLDKAKALIVPVIDKLIGEMKAHMDAIHNFWINRKNK